MRPLQPIGGPVQNSWDISHGFVWSSMKASLITAGLMSVGWLICPFTGSSLDKEFDYR